MVGFLNKTINMDPECGCCGVSCCPGLVFPNVLHLTLFNMNLKCPCFHGLVIPVHFVPALGPNGAAYRAIWAVPCATVHLCPEGAQAWYKLEVACQVDDPFPNINAKYLCGSATTPAVEEFDFLTQYTFDLMNPPAFSCDPLYYRYTSDPNATAIFGACDGDDPEITTDQPIIEVELTL